MTGFDQALSKKGNLMRAVRAFSFLIFVLGLAAAPLCAQNKTGAEVWLTVPDKSALFERQKAPLRFAKTAAPDPVIDVDDRLKYQTIDGFGFALTGGSAQHMIHMDAAARAALIKELFAAEGNHIGVSYLRVSIGASDLNDHVFSYDDLPAGQTDPEMLKFSLDPDRANVIPVLKEILKVNPKILILGSPWSAPAWMKTNE